MGSRPIRPTIRARDASSGTFSIAVVTGIVFYVPSCSATTVVYFDLTELVTDEPVAALALAVDYATGLVTITVAGEAVMGA